jgi:hypothetical protein
MRKQMVILHILFYHLMTQNKNSFQKMFADLAGRNVFVCALLLFFAPKTAFLKHILNYFPGKARELKMVNLHISILSLSDTKQKSIKKLVALAVGAIPLLFAPKRTF